MRQISNIKYPFRLKNDPKTCGDPSYELFCENNMTVLTLFSGKYYVQEINYKDYTIRLVDPGIQETDCSSIPQFFLTRSNFSYSDPYELDSSEGNINIIYLNCSKAVKDDPGYVDTAPCINRDSESYLYAFAVMYYPSDNIFDVGRLKDYCQVKVVAMSSSDFLYNISTYQQIHGSLLYGFQLSWLTSPCRDTCGNKASCYFNQTSRDVECKKPYDDCYYPIGNRVNCTLISKPLVLVEDVSLGIVKGVAQIFGTTLSFPSNPENLGNKISMEIGRVTGGYILPFLVTRYVVGLMIFFMLLIYTYRRRHISMYVNIEVFLQGSTLMPIRYSYKEIKNMARNFKDKLGEGGFGAVYKGKLRSGPFVAIKMLGKSKGNGQDFINEVATIGRIHHINVVGLIGFCVERSKRALIYELVEEKDIEMDEISNEEMINVKKMFITSLWCIQLKPSDRPPMDKVIEMLEGDIENIEMPPKPSLYPNEVIQGDLEETSDEIESDAAID